MADSTAEQPSGDEGPSTAVVELAATATASATHPEGTVLDEDGHPVEEDS